MYWNTEDPDQLMFCGPKYYAYNQTHCKKDPHFWTTGPTYCIANLWNVPGYDDLCTTSNPFINSATTCCYWNELNIGTPIF